MGSVSSNLKKAYVAKVFEESWCVVCGATGNLMARRVRGEGPTLSLLISAGYSLQRVIDYLNDSVVVCERHHAESRRHPELLKDAKLIEIAPYSLLIVDNQVMEAGLVVRKKRAGFDAVAWWDELIATEGFSQEKMFDAFNALSENDRGAANTEQERRYRLGTFVEPPYENVDDSRWDPWRGDPDSQDDTDEVDLTIENWVNRLKPQA